MKKSLLGFFMLILCISFLPTGTFAQVVTGGESSGGIDVGIDGGISNPTPTTVPPAGIKNVKRNNGNGTTFLGVAEARLGFNKGTDVSGIQLQSVSYISGGGNVEGAVTNVTIPDIQNGYISYPLGKNINPAKKLMFHFSSPGGTFSIPETN